MTYLDILALLGESGFTDENLATLEHWFAEEHDIEEYAEIGYFLYQQGFFDKAAIAFEKYLAVEADDELSYYLADIYFQLGDDDKSILLLDSIPRDAAFYVQGQILLAEIYNAQGLSDVAYRKLQSLQNISDIEQTIITGLLAEQLFLMEDFDEAIDQYLLLKSKNVVDLPFSIDERLALSYSKVGAYLEALPYFEKASGKASDLLEFLNEYAYALYQAGEREKSFSTFEEIIKNFPEQTSILNYYIELLIQEELFERAEKLIAQGLSHNEFSEQLYFLQAIVFDHLGKSDEALKILHELIQGNPDAYAINDYYLDLCIRSGAYEAALMRIDDLEEQGDFEPKFIWYKAQCYLAVDEDERANDAFFEAFYFLNDSLDFLESYKHFLENYDDYDTLERVEARIEELKVKEENELEADD
ncbi:tetratricopeptide repeat protein [Culicoidibacter larvae]|uniref:Tetratricopeptide repeat protein n=1 Tax=Culicoidibacter larvae TaxID=2579976 RepID=A0A5R8QFR8_9FIRM|nr:tetratricopeptide repeat protein [Culicoidibacter larvae]TLG76600.1 tetratricopeptide repeat protein [Culicoidibacter larvae]